MKPTNRKGEQKTQGTELNVDYVTLGVYSTSGLPVTQINTFLTVQVILSLGFGFLQLKAL